MVPDLLCHSAKVNMYNVKVYLFTPSLMSPPIVGGFCKILCFSSHVYFHFAVERKCSDIMNTIVVKKVLLL